MSIDTIGSRLKGDDGSGNDTFWKHAETEMADTSFGQDSSPINPDWREGTAYQVEQVDSRRILGGAGIAGGAHTEALQPTRYGKVPPVLGRQALGGTSYITLRGHQSY